MNGAVIEADKLNVVFNAADRPVVALSDVSLHRGAR